MLPLVSVAMRKQAVLPKANVVPFFMAVVHMVCSRRLFGEMRRGTEIWETAKGMPSAYDETLYRRTIGVEVQNQAASR